ncbi:MAG: hypothetical protein HY329_25705 [Chloroflexi bacterium]|nr:hypothetical protein [Chloroflexota bacterium]
MGHRLRAVRGRDDGFLKLLRGEVRRLNVVGDTTYCKGKVARKWIENGEHLVSCELWCENQRGEVTAPGYAVAVLPSRSE